MLLWRRVSAGAAGTPSQAGGNTVGYVLYTQHLTVMMICLSGRNKEISIHCHAQENTTVLQELAFISNTRRNSRLSGRLLQSTSSVRPSMHTTRYIRERADGCAWISSRLERKIQAHGIILLPQCNPCFKRLPRIVPPQADGRGLIADAECLSSASSRLPTTECASLRERFMLDTSGICDQSSFFFSFVDFM